MEIVLMNKKLVPVIVILLLLAGGGYYLKTKGSPAGVVGNQTDSQVMNEAAEFANAIESGKPTVCTMAKGDDKMEYQIKGKMMRMQTTTTMKDESGVSKTTIGHIINDTKYLYIWDDTTKQGSKMAVPTEEESKEMANKAKDYQANIQSAPKFDNQADYESLKNEGYTVNCQSGSVDDSVFTPPTNVQFIDPSAMMKTIPAMGEDGKYDMSQLEELQKQYGGE